MGVDGEQRRSRGRLAPSPTGSQHLGNARTYLVAWLSARSRGEELLLRIEDIDSPRVKAGAAELILDDLKWLGLDWDGETIVQTTRLAKYQSALEQLKSLELVYPCTCTRSDIADAGSAPHIAHVENEPPVYPGTCAHRRAKDVNGLPDRYAWRFRFPDPHGYRDRYRGEITVPAGQGGDFVVWKSANSPAYQLAVVVDDADMGITDVIRGDDLISSTPRQLAIYQALGLRPPSFAHVPLVVGLPNVTAIRGLPHYAMPA
jgi:glutamyl-tRNA synthetase